MASSSIERRSQTRPPPLQAQTSRRSVRSNVSSQGGGGTQGRRAWGTVKDSIIDGTLKFVGLRPFDDEKRHWVALNTSITLQQLKDNKKLHPRQEEELKRQTSITPKEAAAIKAISGHSIQTPHVPVSPAVTTPSPRVTTPPAVEETDAGGVARQRSEVEPDFNAREAWRRAATLRKTELKPDLWKVAYKSIKDSVTVPRDQRFRREVSRRDGYHRAEAAPPPPPLMKQKSFMVDDDGWGVGGQMDGDGGWDYTDFGSARGKMPTIHEDIFFGAEEPMAREEPDSALPVGPPIAAAVTTPPVKPAPQKVETKRKPDSKVRRNKLANFFPFDAGYSRDCGGLGLTTYVLRFKYDYCDDQQTLDEQLLHKRPYFSYWLMLVHIIVMVIALAVYGFAPYGWDYVQRRDTVRMTNLAFVTAEVNVAGSIWLGPPQQSLVLLGAVFAPCMRADKQLMRAIDGDRQLEASESGCCVRRDGSGCFQTFINTQDCLPRFSRFVFSTEIEGNTTVRAVCGMSPDTCTNPSADLFPSWDFNDLLTWPICRDSPQSNPNRSDHRTCELVGRPCCHGIQGNCNITTREHCDFLQGRFHQEAFLCSQVDCLGSSCGLLPFGRVNVPDQVYRLWLALFLHAGLIHLVLSLLFSFFILRHVEKRLGWLRTSFVYMLSGIGGNLVSAYFVPYNPNVGPAASILGIWAYVIVFWMFERHLLDRPYIELLKLLAILLVLLLVGFLPYIDNYAHIGGFVFGFLLSGIIIPYGNYKIAWHKIKRDPDTNYYRNVKYFLLAFGIVGSLCLAGLFFGLFYGVQDTWRGFSYITCIPFTNTLCTDMQSVLRDRNIVVI